MIPLIVFLLGLIYFLKTLNDDLKIAWFESKLSPFFKGYVVFVITLALSAVIAGV